MPAGQRLAVGRERQGLHVAGRQRLRLGGRLLAGVEQEQLLVGAGDEVLVILQKCQRGDPVGQIVPSMQRPHAGPLFTRSLARLGQRGRTADRSESDDAERDAESSAGQTPKRTGGHGRLQRNGDAAIIPHARRSPRAISAARTRALKKTAPQEDLNEATERRPPSVPRRSAGPRVRRRTAPRSRYSAPRRRRPPATGRRARKRSASSNGSRRPYRMRPDGATRESRPCADPTG